MIKKRILFNQLPTRLGKALILLLLNKEENRFQYNSELFLLSREHRDHQSRVATVLMC